MIAALTIIVLACCYLFAYRILYVKSQYTAYVESTYTHLINAKKPNRDGYYSTAESRILANKPVSLN